MKKNNKEIKLTKKNKVITFINRNLFGIDLKNIKIQTKNNGHLKQIIDTEMQEIEGIARTETFISLEMDFKRQVPIS